MEDQIKSFVEGWKKCETLGDTEKLVSKLDNWMLCKAYDVLARAHEFNFLTIRDRCLLTECFWELQRRQRDNKIPDKMLPKFFKDEVGRNG